MILKKQKVKFKNVTKHPKHNQADNKFKIFKFFWYFLSSIEIIELKFDKSNSHSKQKSIHMQYFLYSVA